LLIGQKLRWKVYFRMTLAMAVSLSQLLRSAPKGAAAEIRNRD
jgi:hypothetical protein